MPQLIAAAVEANPAGAAVVFADATTRLLALSYAELDERSNRVARLLIERGIGPDDLVAVAIPRSVHSVLAVWAVAKTGAGFVPVDPNYPADRVAHMIADSGVGVGLTIAAAGDNLPGATEWLVMDTADSAQLLEEYSAEPISYLDRVRHLYAEHPAYVIYTSGSTGKPKGVVVTHAGLARFCDEQRARYGVTRASRTLHFASPSFDASVLEMLLALGGAATMVVVAPTVYGGAELATVLRREAVTHAFVTPAALASVEPIELDELAVVIVGGDVCPQELVRRWVSPIADGRMRGFFNAYGPTEATIATNISAPLEPGVPVTIGAPIRGLTAYVLNDRLLPVPDRVAGELYVSGDQLARGYHEQPALTAARFVANPFDPDHPRLYRTGDLVRRTESGELEYLGRNDSQLKIRGFRIELGEIDAVLAAHPGVDIAVSIGHELDSGATVVASYVHAANGMPVDIAALTELAEQSLPAHMVPSAIVALDAVPLTPTGKLDRAALPAPVLAAKAFRAPSTPVEEIVAGTFGDVLGVARIGLDDDFFALGGNSLLATQVTARLDAALETGLAVRDLFEAPTVGALAVVVEHKAGSGRARPPLVAGERPEWLPLSLAQQRYWFLNQFDTTASAVDNIPFAVRLSGALDVAALGAAIGDVLARHEVLRTTYPSIDGRPRQLIHPVPPAPFDLRVLDLDEADLVSELIAFALRTFDVTIEVPIANALLRLAPDEHVVAFVVHHVAADGASMAPLARDLMTAYAARVAGQAPNWVPLSVQYADYALWERAVLGDENDPQSLAAQQIAYWQATLAGLPDQLELPTDRHRPHTQSFRGKSIRFEISADRHARLQQLARAEHASLFMVVHAALAVLLARMSGTEDIAVGTPIAGRGERELDDLIGMFVNTLVFRTKVAAGQRFSDLLREVRERDLEAFANADVPFERIVEALNPARSTARNPLFQVGLSFLNLAETTFELPGLSIAGVEFDTRLAKTDLHLSLNDRYADDGMPAEIVAEFGYATDLFDESTVRGFVDRFVRVLDAVIADAAVPVSEIDLLAPQESARILGAWNDTAYEVDSAATLVSMFDATVAAAPKAAALLSDEVVGERVELTYGELDARVNRLARFLIERGVAPEDRVALAIRRSIDLVVAMYAVAKSGAAYVPIDPDQPADRVEYILDTAAPVCVLTTGRDGFSAAGFDTVVIDELDLSACSSVPVSAGERNGVLSAANTAYVIFTSGSTGQPKGVAVSHGAIVNQLQWKTAEFGLNAGDAVLLKTAATFDLSVWEFWSAAVSGGRLVIAAPEGHRDPAYLNELMADEWVTTLHVVPSMLDALLGDGLPDSLWRVLAIGEALPAGVAQRMREAYPRVELFNLYGPTEAAVSITSHRVTAADVVSVPIGVPEWNSRVYVLDSRLRPVPVGVSGELYLAGAQLARGYFGRADLSADRFVACPFGSGVRMYRTGDVVAWNGLGELEYRGRTDFQVKIRGFRIELGEIESAILRQPAVTSAAVLAQSDPRLGDRLVAYLVPVESGTGVDVVAVKSALSAVLPSYMVPGAFVVLDRLPLTVNGKLDRKALPEPEFETQAFRRPSTPIEEIVASVFADVLNVELVGADDDFFAMGGNSLLASRVAARIGAALSTRVQVRALFEAPTVTGLAAEIERNAGSGGHTAPTAQPRPDRIPLSPAQLRMWFLNQFDTASAAYNIPVAIRLSGDLDIAALQRAVEDMVARHEVLRTIYPQTTDGPVQRILEPHEVRVDLAPTAIAEDAVAEQVQRIVSAGFDVSQEVAFRTELLRLGDREHVLVFVAHHVGADGWSMGPLVRDVMLAYTARLDDVAPAWAPLPVQYADYTLWQRERLGTESEADSLISAQAGYWRNELAGLPDRLDLPTDRSRPAVPSFAGGRTEFAIDAQVYAGLAQVARDHQATMFMVVHAALAVLLARMSGTDDIAIGTAVAGRGEAELDDLIGMFVNTLVLRTRVPGELTFAELLARTKDSDLRAFAHADLPFERLVEMLNPRRSTARHPLFQVALSLLNLPERSFELPGLRVDTVEFDNTIAPYDLSLTIWAAGESTDDIGMRGEFTFARDLFDDATVRVFARRFARLLAAIATRPGTPVGDLPLLDPAEYTLLTRGHRDQLTTTELLPDLLTRAVGDNPDAVAVRDAGRSISYRELDEYSSRLARVLIGRGIGPENTVALAFPRSYRMVAMVWAVAKAGGAHVPIDPNYPLDRIRHMVADSGAVAGITDGAYVEQLPGSGWLVLDNPAVEAALGNYSPQPVTDRDRVAPLRAQHPAYMIFTSGSTGIPKGVTVTHAGLAGLVEESTELFGVRAQHRFLHLCSPSFDPSVLEWLCAFSTGATLVIAGPSVLGGTDLAELLRAERVTHAIFTPAVLGTVDPAGLSDLEFLCVGGDVTTPDLMAKWQPGRRYVNGYGPTEASVAVSYGDLNPLRRITIGRPVRGMTLLVLDSRLNPVSPGVAGELYLAGAGLARGYHNCAGLTADRFVADPWGGDGARMYRTGDVVRWYCADPDRDTDDTAREQDWELEWIGRSDFQVKIRGFRIELGEIDAVLADYDDVEFAVTIGRETTTGETMLAAYVLPTPGRVVDPAALTEFAGDILPAHMVPAAIVVLDELPLTPVGKLDRAALPEPERLSQQYLAPATPMEELVARVFTEVLGIERVGADEDFFTLGGSSLVATRAVGLLRAETGAQVRVQWFFTDPTVAGLARRISVEQSVIAESGVAESDVIEPRGTEPDAVARDDANAALGVLLPIRSAGAAAALFCIHPMAGLSWCYSGLAPSMPVDRPLFGLQSPALSEPDYWPDSFDSMVRRYVAEIRAAQPEGPYSLLGWSLGGALAHAIAVELQTEGAEVALLVLLDGRSDGDIADFRTEVRAAFAQFGVDAFAGDDDIRYLDDAALAALHAAIPSELAVLTPQRVRQIYGAAVHSVELALAHQHKIFRGTMDYFTAAGHESEPAAWQPYVTGAVTTHPTAATHEQLTSPEALADIGPRLTTLLNRPAEPTPPRLPATAQPPETPQSSVVSGIEPSSTITAARAIPADAASESHESPASQSPGAQHSSTALDTESSTESAVAHDAMSTPENATEPDEPVAPDSLGAPASSLASDPAACSGAARGAVHERAIGPREPIAPEPYPVLEPYGAHRRSDVSDTEASSETAVTRDPVPPTEATAAGSSANSAARHGIPIGESEERNAPASESPGAHRRSLASDTAIAATATDGAVSAPDTPVEAGGLLEPGSRGHSQRPIVSEIESSKIENSSDAGVVRGAVPESDGRHASERVSASESAGVHRRSPVSDASSKTTTAEGAAPDPAIEPEEYFAPESTLTSETLGVARGAVDSDIESSSAAVVAERAAATFEAGESLASVLALEPESAVADQVSLVSDVEVASRSAVVRGARSVPGSTVGSDESRTSESLAGAAEPELGASARTAAAAAVRVGPEIAAEPGEVVAPEMAVSAREVAAAEAVVEPDVRVTLDSPDETAAGSEGVVVSDVRGSSEMAAGREDPVGLGARVTGLGDLATASEKVAAVDAAVMSEAPADPAEESTAAPVVAPASAEITSPKMRSAFEIVARLEAQVAAEVEAARLADEAEAARLADEARDARLAEAAARLAEAAEAVRLADEAQWRAEVARQAEAARLAEEAEAARQMEAAQQAEAAREARAARQAAALREAVLVTTRDVDDISGVLPLIPNAGRLLDIGVEVRAIVIDVPAGTTPDAVQSAVDTVLEQHPMLWVRLRQGDSVTGTPIFEVPAAEERFDEAFLRLDRAGAETAIPFDDVVREVATELDPARGRNIRFVLVTGRAAATLIVVANGLVVDDSSWRTIIDKLAVAWSRGRHATAAVPESGLRALLSALSRRTEGSAAFDEIMWWQDILSTVPATLNVAGGTNPRARRRVSLTITTEGTAAVAAAAAAHEAGIDEVLLTAAALTLITAAGETVTRTIGPVVRLAADARSLITTDAIVGGFTTDFPLPLRLDGVDIADALVGGPAAGIAIEQIRELRRAAPARGVGYGVLRYLNRDTASRLRALPKGRFALRYRDLRPAKVHTDAPVGDLLLEVMADATPEGMLVRFDYASDVFGGDEVKTFAEHWIRALGGLAEHGQRLVGG